MCVAHTWHEHIYIYIYICIYYVCVCISDWIVFKWLTTHLAAMPPAAGPIPPCIISCSAGAVGPAPAQTLRRGSGGQSGERINGLVLLGKSWKICRKLCGFSMFFPQKPWGFPWFPVFFLWYQSADWTIGVLECFPAKSCTCAFNK